MRALVHGPLALVLFIGAGGSVARADAAPPDGYVDPCKDVRLDEGCRRCTIPEFKDSVCHKDAVRDGLVERCSGWSSRMYCPGGGGPTPKPAAPSPESPPAPPPESPPAAPPDPPAKAAAPPVPAEHGGPRGAASGGSCSVGGDAGRGGLAGLVLLLASLATRRRARR